MSKKEYQETAHFRWHVRFMRSHETMPQRTQPPFGRRECLGQTTRHCSRKIAEAQAPNIMNITSNPYYQRALEYIQQNDLNALPKGRHTIDGDNLWVNIVDSVLRPQSEAKFEAHNQYIDIQIPLSAPESYGVKSRNECKQPIGEFNEADDYILFEDEITAIETRQPGEMIVFTPDDAHAPLIGDGPIHKAIFKVIVK